MVYAGPCRLAAELGRVWAPQVSDFGLPGRPPRPSEGVLLSAKLRRSPPSRPNQWKSRESRRPAEVTCGKGQPLGRDSDAVRLIFPQRPPNQPKAVSGRGFPAAFGAVLVHARFSRSPLGRSSAADLRESSGGSAANHAGPDGESVGPGRSAPALRGLRCDLRDRELQVLQKKEVLCTLSLVDRRRSSVRPRPSGWRFPGGGVEDYP